MRASVCNNVPCMSWESDQCFADAETRSLLTFVFLWFALGRSLFLFQGLSLAVLSPPAQLKVDKFPHHEGLSEADGCQDSYPTREGKQWLKKNALMLVYNEFHTWCQLNLKLPIIAAPHNISLCLNATRKKKGRILSPGCAWRMSYCKFDSNCI